MEFTDIASLIAVIIFSGIVIAAVLYYWLERKGLALADRLRITDKAAPKANIDETRNQAPEEAALVCGARAETGAHTCCAKDIRASKSLACPIDASPERIDESEYGDFLSQMKRSSRVYILGSAPSASIKDLRPSDTLVCINGSMAAFPDLIPDILVINGHTVKKNPSAVADASMAALKNRRVRHLVCLTTSGTFTEMLIRLRDAGLQWDTTEELSKSSRQSIFDLANGKLMDPANVSSTGITAVCWAKQSGALNIVLSGFSLQGGHSYIAGETPRGHAQIDADILNNYLSDVDGRP